MGQQIGKPRWIRLEAWKDGASATALPALRDALHLVHGFCTDVHAFANKALTIEFELEGEHIGEFRDALEQAGVHLAPESCMRLRELAWEVDRGDEIDGTLFVELVHDEPDRPFVYRA